MKAAVIGCGNISKMHFIALSGNPETEIVAVADIKPERADGMAEKYGAKAYYSFDELLEKEKPDVIHICTPHYLHTEMAVKALSKGINVLTEKPCSTTAEEVDALRKSSVGKREAGWRLLSEPLQQRRSECKKHPQLRLNGQSQSRQSFCDMVQG